jgi:deoxyribonuclease V
VTPREAARLQSELRGLLRLEPFIGPVRLVAGADVAFSRRDDLVFAAVVLVTWPDCVTTATATAVREGTFPYIPGLLSFREGPAVLEAFGRLDGDPDLVLFDGQGIAHPRRLGLAAHLGLLLDIPSIGCAKSRLCGDHEEPGSDRGSIAELKDGGDVIGAAVRTRDGVRPVYVSPGHRMNLASAVSFTLAACRGFRLPEPTRRAHALVTSFKAETLGGGPVRPAAVQARRRRDSSTPLDGSARIGRNRVVGFILSDGHRTRQGETEAM